MYPRTKFVSQNTIFKQVEHVESEAVEVAQALALFRRQYEPGHLAEELVDLQHSADTALRILQERYGIDIETVRATVIAKNRDRNYYPDDRPDDGLVVSCSDCHKPLQSNEKCECEP